MIRHNILSLCDLTGSMVAPYVEAGHHATIIDTQHEGPQRIEHASGGSLTKLSHNVLDLICRDGRSLCDWLPWWAVFAFPPCDDLAVSGAKHFKRKGLGALVKALAIVDACRTICEASGARYMIENPRSTLSTYWREPDHRVQPWHFNRDRVEDSYVKYTCLWTGGGFVLPAVNTDDRTLVAIAQAKEFYPEIRQRGKLVAAVRDDPRIDSDWFPDDRVHKAGPKHEGGRGNFRSAGPAGFAAAVFEANK